MVISRLGQSLDKIFVQRKFRFSVNTVLQLASQLVRIWSARIYKNSTTNVLCQDLSPPIHPLP
jgi:hypothetical protein